VQLAIVVIRVALGAVFLSSALAKSARLRSFQEYLLPLLGGYAKMVALATVGTELVLAATSPILVTGSLWGWLTAGTLAVFTTAYSVRLVVSEEVFCACWSGVGPDSEERSVVQRALAPCLLGVRNSALVVGALLTVNLGSPYGGSHALTWSMAGTAGCLAIVAAGIGSSVLRQRSRGGMTWMIRYAPRWRHVSRCGRLGEAVE
jgi:hypothetical protein